MRTPSTVKLDQESFGRLKRRIRNMSQARERRLANPRYAAALPEEIGIQLTTRCNLRCRHCFQLNDAGYFHALYADKPTELNPDILEKLLLATRPVKSDLYLWGGEPLLHREWNRIGQLLEQDPRWIVLCTNGLLLEKRMEEILRISSHLALLVSIDGFQEEHDRIRGLGTFDRLIKQLQQLLVLQKQGSYRGKISLNCVLSDVLIGRLYEFLEYCENLGVDTLYFCFPWYIGEESAQRMDDLVQQHFPQLLPALGTAKPSWYSYQYHLDPQRLPELLRDMRRIASRSWKLRVRYQPELRLDEVEEYVLGKDRPAQRRGCCLAVSNRMDVLADGQVSMCKNFPELAIGSLHEHGVAELWHHEKFDQMRAMVHQGLMPVCSKCILLYLNGV